MFRQYLSSHNHDEEPNGSKLNKGFVESPGSNTRAFNSTFTSGLDKRSTSAALYSQSHRTIDIPLDDGIPAHLIRPKSRGETFACTPSVAAEEKPAPPHVIDESIKTKALTPAKAQVHLYSPAIAKELNPKQPDITGAVILRNLSLWQNNDYKQTLIDGRRHSFRSLADIHQDMPYLTKSAIHKGIGRLEERLGDEFRIRRDKERLWFSIGTKTMTKMSMGGKKSKNNNKMHGFKVTDAVDTGGIRAAVLLSNLKYSLDHFTDPVTDDAGNPYAELSPKKLCPILGFSEDTISRALKDMINAGKILRHSQRTSFFALFDASKTTSNPPKPQPAEVHKGTAEVHSRPAEVHTQPAEVHSTPHDIALEPLITLGLQRDAKVTYVNECVNESGNECVKGRDMTATAPLRCQDSLLSKGLQMIQSLADSRLSQMRMSQVSKSSSVDLHIDDWNQQLTYEYIEPDDWNALLSYDYVDASHRVRSQVADEKVESMKELWMMDGIKLGKDDSSKLRQLFFDNPGINEFDLIELYGRVIHPPLVWTTSKPTERASILTKVRTAKSFLRYLPQIIVLLHQSEGEDIEWVQIDEPWKHIDYSYLGRIPKSKLLDFDHEEVTKEYVD